MDISIGVVLISAIASFIACFFSALAGGGAGLILLPILIIAGLPFINALASHKLAVGFIGIGSTFRYARENLIDWKIFWWNALLGAPFVVAGTLFATALDQNLMLLLAGLFILLMAGVSWLKKSSGLHHSPYIQRQQVIIGSLLLVPIAFYSGWISVASGVFTTMLYVYLLRYDQLHATAMTLAANGLVWNAIGAIAHLTLGHIDWEIAPGLVIGAVSGSYLGASLGIRQGNKFLKPVFLLSAVVSGLVLVYKAL
ncbi:sulfite exporter TauE/SafE family protein [Thiothrix nivea]|uniref:Probable membrane transporter protein n=1 Tax=Thiothrix nivea (strain ATCC 35100 / DSM 5205 / JP2) TaxID=870187 RepID=A0A656HA17_THINJ|nr:sulfite exporter TauE/SafE family protein [Thiothrix nivea]EIJ33821.1 protein of unknown function DUF81 [Thiothrix nivea DSM 5205]